jgi:hypothetical protein
VLLACKKEAELGNFFYAKAFENILTGISFNSAKNHVLVGVISTK